jgi:hypothetical protein
LSFLVAAAVDAPDLAPKEFPFGAVDWCRPEALGQIADHFLGFAHDATREEIVRRAFGLGDIPLFAGSPTMGLPILGADQ